MCQSKHDRGAFLRGTHLLQGAERDFPASRDLFLFLQAFDVLLELAGLDYWLHLFPAVNQGIGAFETLQIATRTGVFQSLFCFFIRDFHSKG